MNSPAPAVLLPVFGAIDCLNILIICLTTFDSSKFLGAKSNSKVKITLKISAVLRSAFTVCLTILAWEEYAQYVFYY